MAKYLIKIIISPLAFILAYALFALVVGGVASIATWDLDILVGSLFPWREGGSAIIKWAAAINGMINFLMYLTQD